MRSLLAFAAPLVLLSACAATPGPHPTTSAAVPITADTAYGMFLAGNAAMNEGRSGDASRLLDMARAQSGGEVAVAERAFSAALAAGEIARAAALAPEGEAATESNKRLGRLVKAVDLLAAGKAKPAYDTLKAEPVGFRHRSAAVLLAPWAAAAAGDVEASLVRPDARGDTIVEYYGVLGQAFLYERARRYDEAETAFKQVTGQNGSELAVIAYAQFLERRDRRPDAVATLDVALARTPGSIAMKNARAHAASSKAATPMLTLREGAALALLPPASSMIQARQAPMGLAYLRLSLRLDPDRNDAWLMVGDFLQGLGDVEAAREAYSRPKPGSNEYVSAQVKLAWSYQNAGDKAQALKLARAAAATGDIDSRVALADLLRANDEYSEAVAIMTEVMQTTPDPRLYFARALALEQLGRWKEAEADLVEALRLRPTDAEILNHLGYSWIDRGERLNEALAMVQKAVERNPRSGAMIDSLGWAYFRMGNYPTAVRRLEQAVELQAGDPDINNHLGDAYWMVGRKDEAVFQWRRVLSLRPDPKTKADAEAKLASGAGPVAPAAKIAGQ